MVLPYQGLGLMVLMHTAMELATVYLMLATAIRGFVGAWVLAEDSVVAGAEVEEEADLVIRGKLKFAGNCRKDEYYAKR